MVRLAARLEIILVTVLLVCFHMSGALPRATEPFAVPTLLLQLRPSQAFSATEPLPALSTPPPSSPSPTNLGSAVSPQRWLTPIAGSLTPFHTPIYPGNGTASASYPYLNSTGILYPTVTGSRPTAPSASFRPTQSPPPPPPPPVPAPPLPPPPPLPPAAPGAAQPGVDKGKNPLVGKLDPGNSGIVNGTPHDDNPGNPGGFGLWVVVGCGVFSAVALVSLGGWYLRHWRLKKDIAEYDNVLPEKLLT